jgi:cobalamin biosynthesis Mg chelatase CobN
MAARSHRIASMMRSFTVVSYGRPVGGEPTGLLELVGLRQRRGLLNVLPTGRKLLRGRPENCLRAHVAGDLAAGVPRRRATARIFGSKPGAYGAGLLPLVDARSWQGDEDLAEETKRVFRARVVNPRWVAAMQRHGYKGAFEMAATVDYLFGFDAGPRRERRVGR